MRKFAVNELQGAGPSRSMSLVRSRQMLKLSVGRDQIMYQNKRVKILSIPFS